MASSTGVPSWLTYARELVGVKEIIGSRNEQKILQFFAEAAHPEVHSEDTPWCAAFANAMLRRAGYAGTGSLAARSFLTWGTKLDKPTPGCIVVFKRGNSAWQGHVGFVDRVLPDGRLMVTGGNQGNAVSTIPFGTEGLLGYRWPLVKSAPVAKPKPAADAGKISGGAAAGGSVVVATGAAVEAGWSVGEIVMMIVIMLVFAGLAYGAWRWWQARKATPQEIASDETLSRSNMGFAPPGPAEPVTFMSKADTAIADGLAASIAAAALARAAVAKAAEPRRKRKKAATVKRRAAKADKKRRA